MMSPFSAITEVSKCNGGEGPFHREWLFYVFSGLGKSPDFVLSEQKKENPFPSFKSENALLGTLEYIKA